jgi:alkylation response protein AidB-like acyl-CoA dehydrogenase
MTISFSFSDEQAELQRVARELFAERSPLGRVREIEAGSIGFDDDLWLEMADRGWLGLAVPEAFGGTGGSFLDLYPLYEELGRALVPSPHADTVAVAADILLGSGSDEQKARHLPPLCSGRSIVSLALVEADGGVGAHHVDLRAAPDGNHYVLSGTKLLVAHARSAAFFLCAARTQDSPDDGVTLLMVDAGAQGLTSAPIENLAGADLSEVVFDDVRTPSSSVVGPVGRGWAVLGPTLTKAAVLQTASIVGAAQAVLDMSNQYAKDREQFGRAIGSYQAVQYLVSDILIDLHSVDLLAKQAAYRIDAGSPFRREASIAVIHGKRAAAHLHRQAHEIHAGVGFMRDHNLNLFSRRSKYWENNFGDVRYFYGELASTMGTGPAGVARR